MALTKAEQATIENVIKRLKCTPRDSGKPVETDEVREALLGPARIYLDTWVIGALETLLPGQKHDPKLGRRLSEI